MDTEIDYDRTAVSMADLFGSRQLVVAPAKTRAHERGELLKYFSEKTGWPIPRIAFKVTKLSVQDLYYIRSASDAYEKQGNPWSKGFFGMLKTGV